jgi:hypothetical protein
MFNPELRHDSSDPIAQPAKPASPGPSFMFIPNELDIEGRPELRILPANVMFAAVGRNAAGPMLGSALYEPDLSSLNISGSHTSLTYKNVHAGDGAVRITYDSDKQSWEGEKTVGGKVVVVAFGANWKQFFTQLTLLGLAEGEGCVMESIREESPSQ